VERIGNCRIVGEIGSGGMATVYKAVQEPLGRTVAIKVLKPSIAVDSQFAQRFEREAHFMASLQHENILHVHDFIKDGRSMYIVMEYVQGIDLYDLLERVERLPTDVAALLALQVSRALDYAHFRGIIHRDIKPANIMISHQGVVKLMDFGIARDDRLSDLTETGTGLGTPSYMSPEQILGDKLDFRSDLFSLGIVLYQMATGRKPFLEDDSRTVMQKIRLDRYPPPRRLNPQVPRALERIMGRCMEKMPANRYPTTQALIDDLVEFLAPRVPMSHNARVVGYLRDVAVLGEAEADEILQASGPRGTRRTHRDRRLVRHVALVEGLTLVGVLASAFFIQSGSDGGLGEALAATTSTEPPASRVGPGDLGYVRIVVDPWAEVFVDGNHVATTPTARPIPLPPGRHFLKFENPYHRTVDREVEVVAGETLVVELALEPTVGATSDDDASDDGEPAGGASGAATPPIGGTSRGAP